MARCCNKERVISLILAMLVATSSVQCQSDKSSRPVAASIKTVNQWPQVSFNLPLDFQVMPGQTDRVAIVEQGGIILSLALSNQTAQPDTLLDIRDRINKEGWEEGLLGLAFHSDYAANGYLYVNYTAANPRRTVISRFARLSSNPLRADPASEVMILQFNQPFANHNGGCLVFGPDGFLYIGTGDGGSGGDPQGNGQNRATLLGKMLRIDVDNPSGGRAYGIPADNPLVGNSNGWREEIWAWGLRNPWRYSFDRETGQLWIADVGQNAIEEVNIGLRGANYGWNTMEGSRCFNPPSGCVTTGLTLPIWEYDHSLGQSITGGYVYRGSRLSSLVGAYLVADFISGRIWGIRPNGSNYQSQLLAETGLSIASFGEDSAGNLYLCAFDGRIYRIE